MEESKKKKAEEASGAVRTYKDRIFRMVFKEKQEFLELYNAMNGTDYHNPEDLTVTTLENAIYMNMKNDVSFLLHDRLTLYEHQSTDNPNMPLRNFFYVSDIYSRLTQEKNLHCSRPVLIPEPRFVEFYNGTKSFRSAANADFLIYLDTLLIFLPWSLRYWCSTSILAIIQNLWKSVTP